MKLPNPFKYIRKRLLFLLPIFCLIAIPFSPQNVHADKVFYSIRLDSFDEIEKAEEMVKDLKDLGHEAFYRSEIKEDGKEAFHVYIERFDSKTEAEKEANVLKELDLIKDFTVQELTEIKKIDSKKDEKMVQRGYSLQVSSLRDKVNAEKMVKRLKGSGYDAFYRKVTLKDKGVWHRVFIQGYESKRDALIAFRRLKESGLLLGQTPKKPIEPTGTLPGAPKNDKKVFFLHVSSLREKANAEQDVKILNENGYKAFFVEEGKPGDKWFRVYIGEFDSEKSARKEGLKLVGKGLISYFKPIEIDKLKLEK